MSRVIFGGSDEEPDAFGRPVSPHPNFVTAEGLRFIELELARAQDRAVKAAASGDRVGAARGEAEVVYWVTRRGTAQVAPAPPDADRVYFGSAATIARADGRRETWRIVGEDEAEAGGDVLSYVAPLAQALMGRKIGEVVTVDGETVEIVSIGQVPRP